MPGKSDVLAAKVELEAALAQAEKVGEHEEAAGLFATLASVKALYALGEWLEELAAKLEAAIKGAP